MGAPLAAAVQKRGKFVPSDVGFPGSYRCRFSALVFRVVLSEVPTARAGVGSGVVITTQQSSLALGVATLGTLFLALVPALDMTTS